MSGTLSAIKKYLHPDMTVLDEKQAFDPDLSAEFFRMGNRTGCVVLHGIGGTPANVRVVSDALAGEGYTVLAPVLPGHRETVRAMSKTTWRDWLSAAEGAYDRLRACGCGRIYIVGLSLGGILAGTVAEEPERPAAGAVMICAPVRMQQYLHLARAIRHLMPVIRYQNEGTGADELYDEGYRQMYDSGFPTGKLQDLHILILKFRRGLKRLTCPLLFFSAKYDNKVSPSSAGYIRRHAGNASPLRTVFLENSPHGCTYGPERDLVAETVRDFIKEQEKEQAG